MIYNAVIKKEAGIMKFRSKVLAFLLIFTVIFCGINLTILESDNLSIRSGVESDFGHTQSYFSISDTATVEYCTTELIGIHALNTLFCNRLLTKNVRTRVSFGSVLSALASVFFLFEIPFRRIKCGSLPRCETGLSSVILCYIHEKDGKK